MSVRAPGLLLLSGLVGCAAVAPALTSLAVAFGQDLIASASVNYAPRYAEQLEALLVAMAREGTGLPIEEQLAKAGYRPPSPDYAQSAPDEPRYGDGYGQDGYDGYDPYDSYQDDPYYEDGAYDGAGPYEDDPYYAGNPYEDDPYYTGDPYGNDPYDAGDPYENDGDGTPPTGAGRAGDPPYPSGSVVPYGDPGPLTMDVAVLVRRAGSHAVRPIEDGAVLFDGAGDPARGDLLRFHVQVNRPSFVYVIGVDATGYVAQIFPDPGNGHGNPVEPGYLYALPEGDQWWGLDQQPGIEHVYFIASLAPRPDIEAAVRQLGTQPRRLAVENHRPVQRPAVLPTRGLVKVEAAPVLVPTGTDAVQIVPESFMQAGDGTAVSMTRWFHHETR